MRSFRRRRRSTRIAQMFHLDEDRVSLLLASLAGVLLALCAIRAFDARVKPMVAELAQIRVQSAVNRLVSNTVARTLTEEAVGYQDIISLEKDNGGQITALTSNIYEMNRLRAEILSGVLEELNSLNGESLNVPLEELTGLSILSGRGPSLPVRVRSIGTAGAQFRNEFTTGGLNQTCHRVILDVFVEVTVLIPGGKSKVEVSTQVCVAETVLVGEVPETYLQLSPPA